jgi:hypothetical protein
MLWDPAAHEPLLQEAWNGDRVRAAIRVIAADAEDVFDGGWLIHPRDRDPSDPELWSGTYLGGAGVVDALCRLAERGLVELQRDYLEYLEGLEPDEPGAGLHGIGRYTLWTGDLGTALYLADCVDGAGRLPLP